MSRSVWNVLKCLATSRKVWVALIGSAGAITLYIQGTIDADKLASAMVALATAVILAIAAEDSAGKLSGYTDAPAGESDWPQCACGAWATHVADGPVWYCDKHAPEGTLSISVQVAN